MLFVERLSKESGTTQITQSDNTSHTYGGGHTNGNEENSQVPLRSMGSVLSSDQFRATESWSGQSARCTMAGVFSEAMRIPLRGGGSTISFQMSDTQISAVDHAISALDDSDSNTDEASDQGGEGVVTLESLLKDFVSSLQSLGMTTQGLCTSNTRIESQIHGIAEGTRQIGNEVLINRQGIALAHGDVLRNGQGIQAARIVLEQHGYALSQIEQDLLVLLRERGTNRERLLELSKGLDNILGSLASGLALMNQQLVACDAASKTYAKQIVGRINLAEETIRKQQTALAQQSLDHTLTRIDHLKSLVSQQVTGIHEHITALKDGQDSAAEACRQNSKASNLSAQFENTLTLVTLLHTGEVGRSSSLSAGKYLNALNTILFFSKQVALEGFNEDATVTLENVGVTQSDLFPVKVEQLHPLGKVDNNPFKVLYQFYHNNNRYWRDGAHPQCRPDFKAPVPKNARALSDSVEALKRLYTQWQPGFSSLSRRGQLDQLQQSCDVIKRFSEELQTNVDYWQATFYDYKQALIKLNSVQQTLNKSDQLPDVRARGHTHAYRKLQDHVLGLRQIIYAGVMLAFPESCTNTDTELGQLCAERCRERDHEGKPQWLEDQLFLPQEQSVIWQELAALKPAVLSRCKKAHQLFMHLNTELEDLGQLRARLPTPIRERVLENLNPWLMHDGIGQADFMPMGQTNSGKYSDLLISDSYVFTPIADDGNCLFHALAMQGKLQMNVLKANIKSYLKHHPDVVSFLHQGRQLEINVRVGAGNDSNALASDVINSESVLRDYFDFLDNTPSRWKDCPDSFFSTTLSIAATLFKEPVRIIFDGAYGESLLTARPNALGLTGDVMMDETELPPTALYLSNNHYSVFQKSV